MNIKTVTVLALAVSLPSGVSLTNVATPHHASVASASSYLGVKMVPPMRGVKHFWSAIIRVFITLSRHATLRMGEYRMSTTLLKHILNNGKVIYRANGVTKVQSGGVTVVVNSRTGNVITIYRAGGGGGGGR